MAVIGGVRPGAGALCDLPAVPASCTEVRYAVRDALADAAVNLADVDLAVSEAVTNVVVHAYRDRDPADGPGRVRVALTVDDDAICVVVDDDGVGLRPRTDSPGLGIGLPLIASLCDMLELEHRDDGTRIHMRFALAPTPVAMDERSNEAPRR